MENTQPHRKEGKKRRAAGGTECQTHNTTGRREEVRTCINPPGEKRDTETRTKRNREGQAVPERERERNGNKEK